MTDLLALSARFIDEGVYEGPGAINRMTTELSEVTSRVVSGSKRRSASKRDRRFRSWVAYSSREISGDRESQVQGSISSTSPNAASVCARFPRSRASRPVSKIPKAATGSTKESA